MSSSTASTPSLLPSSSKKQRLIILPHTDDAKGPRVAAKNEEDKTARTLLKKIGFDLGDLNKEDEDGCTPMNYFCCDGNLNMCRYVFSRGAGCSKLDTDGYFPMVLAAESGHLKIMQWLYYDCGAQDDIRRVFRGRYSSLLIALQNDHIHVWKWLILNRALSPHSDGILDVALMRNDLRPHDYWRDDKRLPILSWARDAVTNHDNVKLLLTGTLVSSSSSSSSSSAPLVIFQGNVDILELVAAYVETTPKPQELHILRQLINLLPAFIKDVPFIEDEDDADDD